jgi:hypothetical protein
MSMMIKLWRAVCPTTIALLSLTGCGLLGQTKIVRGSVPDSITVISPAFREGGQIPVRFACAAYGGQDITPPLRWSVPVSGVHSLALVIDDADAPGGSYVHWVLFDIDPTTAELLEGSLPAHALQARNTAHVARYTPPCPPMGEVHRYRFTVYALSSTVPMKNGAELKEVLAAIAQHTIARGRINVKFGTRGAR